MKTFRSMMLASAFGAAALAAPGAHASVLWISDGTDNIGQVDTTTGQVVANSVHNTGQPLTDIAFLSNGQMYGTTFTTLLTINKNTGAAGAVGTYAGESGMNALLGTTTGGLLGASFTSTNVYNINPANAALSVFTTAPNTSSGDLAVHSGTLYGLGNSGGPNTLNNLATHTATTMHVGSAAGPTLSTVFGLADDGTTLFAVAGTEVYSVDAATAILTPLFDYSLHENGQDLTAVTGAAFITESGPVPPPSGVPEPTSLALLGAGLLGFGVFARRQRGSGLRPSLRTAG